MHQVQTLDEQQGIHNLRNAPSMKAVGDMEVYTRLAGGTLFHPSVGGGAMQNILYIALVSNFFGHGV